MKKTEYEELKEKVFEGCRAVDQIKESGDDEKTIKIFTLPLIIGDLAQQLLGFETVEKIVNLHAARRKSEKAAADYDKAIKELKEFENSLNLED